MKDNKWKKEMPEVPENVHNAVLTALNLIDADQIPQQKKRAAKGDSNRTVKRKTVRKSKVIRMIRPIAAVAACAIIFITLILFGPVHKTGQQGNLSGNQAANQQGGEQTSESSLSKGFIPDFSIVAHAAEYDGSNLDAGKILLSYERGGVGDFTGIHFTIQGEDIADVKLSIDKGDLYSGTDEKTTEDKYWEELVRDEEIYINDPDRWIDFRADGAEDPAFQYSGNDPGTLYRYLRRGAEITEPFNSDVYYGFCLPAGMYDELLAQNPDESLAVLYHRALDTFEGAKLKVTVTFNNGASLEKNYALTTESLILDENHQFTGEFYDGENITGSVHYAILATEE